MPMANTSESNGRVNSSFAEPGLVLQPEQPVEGQERDLGNYGSALLLAPLVAGAGPASQQSFAVTAV